jgi:glycine/D-amino acid oxidase-like deaminating enzyme/nitrite reductase/ring-hydroxylating ferredoxin subunit
MKKYVSLKGDTEADVVIVGGGITGITLAMLLSQSGKNVTVLEAHRIGHGTTGNSTGNLYVTVDEHLSGIKSKWDSKVMKAVVEARSAALEFIRKTVQARRIDCGFTVGPFNYFAETTDDKIEEFFKKEYEALEEAGLRPEFTDNPGLPFEVRKTLRLPGQAQFHPLEYVQAIAADINGKNCAIYENSAVMSYDEDEGIVRTETGSVKAGVIIMATHTPKGIFTVHTVLGPYREFGVAAPLKGGSCPDGIFWGINQPKHSIRPFRDKDTDYVMVIGDKFKTGQHGDSHKYIEGLQTYLKERFDTGSFRYTWGGQQYRPADGLPYIGRQSEKLYLATGFSTDGLIYGTLSALILSDQISGRKNPFAETFDAGRHTPVKSAKEFIKENADNLLEYLKDTPWSVDADTLRGIQPGQAKIIEKDRRKLAVYKDEKGENHIVSAVCTHMKCVVNWNDSEKSWDCPCHGSRFTVDGDVIEGPAIVKLEKLG